MMAERHRRPAIKGNYAVYLGKDRSFPNDMKLSKGEVYEIGVYPPGSGYCCYQVRVSGGKTDIYLPYPNALSIWDEWMPYKGEPIPIDRKGC